MTDWTAGYTTEIEYTYDFQMELTPSFLAFNANVKGVQHRLDGTDLSYCELGCGNGVSANILAAANPHIQFYATDFTPAHILAAEGLAKAANLENLHLYEQSFEEFQNEPSLPEKFDVISLHGIYTWVSRENQEIILDFIAKRLKPGGLVYVGYNTRPGWAAAEPLGWMLRERIENGVGSFNERIEAGLEFLNKLHEVDALYCRENVKLTAKIKQLRSRPKSYVAHEFLTKFWQPILFADLAADMNKAKMDFLGTVTPLDHFDDLSVTPAQLKMLEEENDPVRRETLRDFMVNEQFRTDLFVRGRVPYSERGAVGAWFNTRMVLTQPYTGEVPKIAWRLGSIPLEPSQCEPILRELVKGPATVKELLDRGVFGEMSWGEITRALTLLVGCGNITPCLPLEGQDAREASCQAMNKALCKRAEESAEIDWLSSPVTGGGLRSNRHEQLFLLALHEGRQEPAEWAELAWQILAPQGVRVLKDKRPQETPEENLAELTAQAEEFAVTRLPILKNLGVLF